MNVTNREVSIIEDLANGNQAVFKLREVQLFKFGASDPNIQIKTIIETINGNGCSMSENYSTMLLCL